MKKIKLTINNTPVEVNEDTNVLTAVRKAGFNLPTLCYMEGELPEGSCRMCLVEIKGTNKLVTSCSEPVREGMRVFTNTEKLINARRINLELILSTHNNDCNNCLKNTKCVLQKLSDDYNCNTERFAGNKLEALYDDSHPSYTRDNSKCILCKKCVITCKNQACNVLSVHNRGFESFVGTNNNLPIIETKCTACGQCVANCPTGALVEKYEIQNVIKALNDKSKMVIAATAPSIRVGLGDLFNLPVGTNVEKQMVESLMAMGFDKVFDINFGADLTIMEEAAEFVERLKNNYNMPMFTSCCPAWVTYVEEYYPEFTKNLSTTKSPQEIFAKVLKTYYAKSVGKDAKDIYFVSIMPCIAKKHEKLKHGDTDAVITVNELAELIKIYNIDFKNLKGKEFDDVMGLSSGAGAIFGASGGVMEAALRTAQDTLTGKDIKDIEFNAIRGSKGVKEATVDIAGRTINICVTSGLNNAKAVLELIKSGKKHYDFIEVMACPGGCINGGGMPRKINDNNAVNKRAKALYKSDSQKIYRKSHDNPNIKKVYEYLNTLEKKEVHTMLHTSFKK